MLVKRSGNPPPEIAKAYGGNPIISTSCRKHAHVNEAFSIGGIAVCMFCASDAVEKETGYLQPWFFTGSPHGADILSALQSQGVDQT